MVILGISALYHDSAAALIVDGQVLRAAQEERFTRVKNDRSFPVNAISWCLEDPHVTADRHLDAVAYYDNPILTCDRFIHSCRALGERSRELLERQYPPLFGDRIWVEHTTRRFLEEKGIRCDHFLINEHHISHAAGAYYPSGFSDAALMVLDGVGEWKTASLGVAEGKNIRILAHLDYPDSLGMLYSAFTYFCGFRVNSGEYKLMGLAAYGRPVYADLITRELVEVREDGSFRLNMDYFEFQYGQVMTGERFEKLFGCPRRLPEAPFAEIYQDLAASIQEVTENIILKLAGTLKAMTGKKNLCMAGGCALNCVANGRLLREGIFDRIYIQPASGDAGGCIGAALYAYYHFFGRDYEPGTSNRSPYLGPEFTDQEIGAALESFGAVFHRAADREELLDTVSGLLAENRVVGFFQGRMEFGPRALGHRSILADPRASDTQLVLNQKIKFRESFRPFAPSVLREHAAEYFELDTESPYMLLTAYVRKERRKKVSGEREDIYSQIRQIRSDVPAITHVDYSARVQTVTREENGLFYDLIERFYQKTGCPMLVNTSFNVRGEPIVCSVKDAYACFRNTRMDILCIGSYILYKEEQSREDGEKWRIDYGTD